MSEKIIKWGFIGCGEVTKTKSGPAFQKVEHSEVVAVMSRDGAKAKAYAKERGIKKWYDDAQELIDDPEVNAIYIATPPSSHATYAIMSMKAGKPAYIEKPMAVTYEECTRINRISNETGVPCFVAYYRRYLPYFQKVKELVENGTIGNIINVQIRFAQPPVFTYEPIGLHTEKGREEICIGNPEHVQQPLIQAVVDHLLGKSVCSCDGESATLTNWVMDKILNKI